MVNKFIILWEFSILKLKQRMEGTWLGILWYLTGPILTLFFLYRIFFDRLGHGIEGYPVYLAIGFFMVSFFAKMTDSGIGSIKKNAILIKSTNVNRTLFVQSEILQAFMLHLLEVLVLFSLMVYSGYDLVLMVYYFIALIPLVVFAYGVSLAISSINVFFFDLDHIWGFIIKMLFIVTPIFYDIGGQFKLFILNLFNPLYYYVTFVRELVVLQQVPELYIFLGVLLFPILSLFFGHTVFNYCNRRFADVL